jgi:hypothetical protein
MARERCLEVILQQIIRAIIDENLPCRTEIIRFDTFLNQLGVMETAHPVHAIEALGDWVPRIFQGISDSALLTPSRMIHHPPATLDTPTEESTPYMDLMWDALATVPEPVCTPPRIVTSRTPEPRYIVEEVLDIIIKSGVLSYWVKWLKTNYYQQEVYKNLHHLEVFQNFERLIVPGAIINNKVITTRKYNTYIRLRDVDHSNLEVEYDTDSDAEGEDDQQAMIINQEPSSSSGAALDSEDSLSWGDLLTDDLLGNNLRDFGEGTSYGAAGPSHLGERQRGGARTAKSWDDFGTKQ